MKSIFKLNKLKINHILNITDVGHLSSDSDEGEDKLKLASKKEKLSVWDIADKYTEIFLNNLKDLEIELPTVMPKATDHISEQIEMIKKLEENGYAYESNGNVYFDTSKVDYHNIGKEIKKLEKLMRSSATDLDFEKAAFYRDLIKELKEKVLIKRA